MANGIILSDQLKQKKKCKGYLRLEYLAKGTTQQAINASSMALQNILEMICDPPVANRVEVLCLGKNVLAASNAVASANMALANFDPVIPLDEVIETMEKVGKSLPYELRCTALGRLSSNKDIQGNVLPQGMVNVYKGLFGMGKDFNPQLVWLSPFIFSSGLR